MVALSVFDKIERVLVRLAVFGLMALVLVQGMMTHDSIRFYMSLGERMEGRKMDVSVAALKDLDVPQPETPVMASSYSGSFTLVLQDYTSLDQARVLVNGQVRGRFSNPCLKINVTPGDTVEVDTQAYRHPVRFRIEKVSSSLQFPVEGMTFTSDQVTMIGKVVSR